MKIEAKKEVKFTIILDEEEIEITEEQAEELYDSLGEILGKWKDKSPDWIEIWKEAERNRPKPDPQPWTYPQYPKYGDDIYCIYRTGDPMPPQYHTTCGSDSSVSTNVESQIQAYNGKEDTSSS